MSEREGEVPSVERWSEPMTRAVAGWSATGTFASCLPSASWAAATPLLMSETWATSLCSHQAAAPAVMTTAVSRTPADQNITRTQVRRFFRGFLGPPPSPAPG